MGGCESCEQNLMAEIEAEADDKEELDEEVQAVLEGEKEAPFAYGPLSGWEGPYCKFCHWMGQILALGVLGGILFGGYYYGVEIGYTAAFGLFIYGPLAFAVGYLGRFPLLGALVGPWVEMFLGKFLRICVTKKAQKQYCAQGIAADGGQEEPMREVMHGTRMHVVAEPWAVEQCAEPDAPGALKRVEVEQTPAGPRVRDIHNFDIHVNQFPNLEYHVDPGAPTVCHTPEQQRMTTLDFDQLIQTQGEGGIERE